MEESKEKSERTVHHILADSYAVYLVALVVGVISHVVFKEHVMPEEIRYVGLVLLPVATFLVIWAQRTSESLRQIRHEKGKLEMTDFCRGPYCVSRSPTHWGLFFSVVGFGFLLNSIFTIATGVLALIISKSFFLKKEENLLAQKYGEEYVKYQKKVKL